jgi:pimeloyl-ACP methyl ester carboxylesterase/predicted glycosyltransferase
MRARYPDSDGFVEHDGLKLYYEIYGEEHDPTVLLMSNSPVTLRHWKAQIPYLARHFRVIAFDAPGGGRADRPLTPETYTDDRKVDYATAILDATRTERAVLVAHSDPGLTALQLAISRPERVLGVVSITPSIPWLTPPHPYRAVYSFNDELDTDEGWAKMNRHYWLRDWPGFVAWQVDQSLPEPYSTKQREDLMGWEMEIDVNVDLAIVDAAQSLGHQYGGAAEEAETTRGSGSLAPQLVLRSLDEAEALCRAVPCPLLVVQGELDAFRPLDRGSRLAELAGGRFVVFKGAGAALPGRHPVPTNLLIKEFVDSVTPRKPARHTWTRGLSRPRRALFLSSPIGLGHARRDLAIADELRALVPDLQIDWLTQHPVTAVLEARDERIHPASAWLASESAHVEADATEHDLRVFQSIRDMDEILVANFMVVHDVLEDEPYDLVIGDESWDVDHFLHENPELKRAPFVWMTDFVGWLPMPDGGEREAFLTADYNAEMIEHVERFPRLRDRAIYVGNPDDIPPERFGPGLPSIREWTEAHYDFSGYVTGFDPASVSDREALRAELGWGRDERVCVVTVGGSGVGTHLLRRVIDAAPAARRAVPGLRMVAVAGPRIDPASLPASDGLEVLGYVDGLYRMLAACDLAVVQGGLSTTMELTALGRPFLYVPLRHHFEQSLVVPHRLGRYGGGRRLDYEEAADADGVAQAIAEEIGRTVEYRPVETDGAARAAALIAELV